MIIVVPVGDLLLLLSNGWLQSDAVGNGLNRMNMRRRNLSSDQRTETSPCNVIQQSQNSFDLFVYSTSSKLCYEEEL
jgi:hypothetical protein